MRWLTQSLQKASGTKVWGILTTDSVCFGGKEIRQMLVYIGKISERARPLILLALRHLLRQSSRNHRNIPTQ